MGASVAAASGLLLLPQSLSLDITSELLHHLSPKAVLCSLTHLGSSTLYLSSTCLVMMPTVGFLFLLEWVPWLP